MFDLDLGSIIVVTKLMEFHTWAEMKIILEDFFQASIVINPFLDDEALIKCNKKINFDFANH